MPELPEVETTRRGLAPHLVGHRITGLTIRQPKLRWQIPVALRRELVDQKVISLERRAKYLLLRTEPGSAIIHLGMSGSLRLVEPEAPVLKHDHVDLIVEDDRRVRFNDPRRFGALLWTRKNPLSHPLLRDLGPEPLSDDFDARYFSEICARRRASIKTLLMNNHIVAGVGNIYANESLYLAGIHPRRAAYRIADNRLERLVTAIKDVLHDAVRVGGTTLRDFVNSDGQPGYFALRLNVYGKDGESCPGCASAIRVTTIGQRASFYCSRCQR